MNSEWMKSVVVPSPPERTATSIETSDVGQKEEAVRPVSQPPVFFLLPLHSLTRGMNE